MFNRHTNLHSFVVQNYRGSGRRKRLCRCLRLFGQRHRSTAMALSILPPPQSLALPSFTSSLITGSVPSSAALHLAISHLSDPVTSKGMPQESAVIFTPSPDLYKTDRGPVEQLSVDEWIENHGLHGEYAHKLTRTHILCGNILPPMHAVPNLPCDPQDCLHSAPTRSPSGIMEPRHLLGTVQ